jgi:excisionase family DNA binding protein
VDSALSSLQLLTVEEVCELLRVKRAWVYTAVNRGELPHVKLAGHLRFQPAALASYIESASHPATSGQSVAARADNNSLGQQVPSGDL